MYGFFHGVMLISYSTKIREFFLRFSPLMDISQSNLESLDDFEHLGDGATKSYIVQLLSLIAADAPHAAGNVSLHYPLSSTLAINITVDYQSNDQENEQRWLQSQCDLVTAQFTARLRLVFGSHLPRSRRDDFKDFETSNNKLYHEFQAVVADHHCTHRDCSSRGKRS